MLFGNDRGWEAAECLAGLTTSSGSRRAVVRHGWTSDDRLRWLTAATAVVALGAPAMAIVGIPPLPIMWPFYRLGIVLPGCGLTRGVVSLARGEIAAAWAWNPASIAVGAVVLAGVVRSAIGVRTGRWFHVCLRPRWWLIVACGVMVAALWVRQYAQADLLMPDR